MECRWNKTENGVVARGHEGQGRPSKEERLMETILKRGASDEAGGGGTEDLSFLNRRESRC